MLRLPPQRPARALPRPGPHAAVSEDSLGRVSGRSANEGKEALAAASGADGGQREGKARALLWSLRSPFCPPRHGSICCPELAPPCALGSAPPPFLECGRRARCCPVLALCLGLRPPLSSAPVGGARCCPALALYLGLRPPLGATVRPQLH